MKKHLNYIKLLLNIIMTILLVLMYDVSFINITFHEVGGLILFLIIATHCLFNGRWINAVSKRISRKSLARRKYFLDVLLLVTAMTILVSGIIISKEVFPDLVFQTKIAKDLHYSASALLLILLGIHLSMHLPWINGMLRKVLSIPSCAKFPKLAYFSVLSLIFACGIFSLITSRFLLWLTTPVKVIFTINVNETVPFGFTIISLVLFFAALHHIITKVYHSNRDCAKINRE